MVNKLILPEQMAEEIRCDGRRQSMIDREAVGALSGVYDKKSANITALARHHIYCQKGNPTLLGYFQDTFDKFLALPRFAYATARLIREIGTVRRGGYVPAEITYHTHPFWPWSEQDLLAAREHKEGWEGFGIQSAELLYMTYEDSFDAVDGDLNRIEVEMC